MPIWSDEAIDYDAGLDPDPKTGTLKPRKTGCWVMTIDECDQVLAERGKKKKRGA